MQQPEDFFSVYFQFTKETEVPRLFHRWCAIAGVGALLGRNLYYPFGDLGNIYPNIYCMLLGEPGTKKSTAIKLLVRTVLKSGYVHIGPNETSKEKFLLDLESGIDYYKKDEDTPEEESILEKNLFGKESEEKTISECLIGADEANNFFGINNISFLSSLGELWDYDGIFKKKLKNSKSVWIPNPTLTILSGNTATNYALAFPTQILGQGFFSRLIHVYAEKTDTLIDDPKKAPEDITQEVIKCMQYMRNNLIGEVKKTAEAARLIKKIYTTWKGIDDVRFSTYSNRRFTHLIKLCIIHTAARLDTTITEQDVIYANTVLSHTEHLMPKALGEFGKSRHSDVSHKIVTLLEGQDKIFSLKEIWKHVHNDLEKMNDLAELIRNLVTAEKIQAVSGGFLARRRVLDDTSTDTLNFDLLTEEERRMSK